MKEVKERIEKDWLKIVLILILILFFYPKRCGDWGTSREAIYQDCACVGIKITRPLLGGDFYNCYGLCLKNTCKYYRLPLGVPWNYCEGDFDCVIEPCSYSCNSKPYAKFLRKIGKDECLPRGYIEEFNCSCVNNVCTQRFCDALHPCSEGLECISFPYIGIRCAKPNPCDYYKCPIGTKCIVGETYPAQVFCSPI